MATKAAELAIRTTNDVDDAVRGFRDVETAAEKSARGVRLSADAADELGGKAGKATGALGALSSGFELVGAEKYAGALQGAGLATDFLSGVGDSLNLVMESTIAKTARARAGAIAHGIASRAQGAASLVAAAGQRALNLAMRANPIGLVITAIALLAGGLVLAWKKSETFRRVTKGAFDAVAAAGRWLWNNALRPAFIAIGKAVGVVMTVWSKMLKALGKVPGFGWAGRAGRAMETAANKAFNLGETIKKIPNKKTPRIRLEGVDRAQNQASSLLNTLQSIGAIGVIGPGGRMAGTSSRVASTARAAATSSSAPVINVTVNGALDPLAVARQIQDILRQLSATRTGVFS